MRVLEAGLVAIAVIALILSCVAMYYAFTPMAAISGLSSDISKLKDSIDSLSKDVSALKKDVEALKGAPPPPPPVEKPLLEGFVLRVGVVQPLTGAFAYEAESGLYGAMMATEEINAAGGILGARIELLVEDFGGDPKVAASAAEKLITVNRVHVLRGSYTSASMYTIMPVAEKYKCPVLTIGCSAKELIEQGWKYIFKTAPLSEMFAEKSVRFLKEVIEPELKPIIGGRPLRIAILHDKSLIAVSDKNEFLRFKDKIAPEWEIVAIETYDIGCPDFKPIIEKLKALNVDVVGMSSFAGDGALILKQSRELGFKPYLFIGIGGGGTQAPKFIELTGPPAQYFFGGSEYWPDRRYPAPEKAREFGEKFYRRWARPLDFQSWTGYAGMYMIKQIIETAAKKSPDTVKKAFEKDDVATMREIIREGLATQKFYFEWCGELYFDERGQMNSIVTITQILPATPGDIWSVHGLTFRTIWPPPYNASRPVFPWKK